MTVARNLARCSAAYLISVLWALGSAAAHDGHVQGEPTRPRIYFNQLGYCPQERKLITVAGGAGGHCEVEDESGRKVLQVPQIDRPWYADYPSQIRTCDLSSLNRQGEYKIHASGSTTSIPFVVHTRGLQDILAASAKTFYYQRASMEINHEYAGPWARPAGHLDRNLRIFVEGEAERRQDVQGGWYDAGDYGKYVVNGGISVATLLLLYERFPLAIGDQLRIPESGNGRSDLLDEVRYELDWLMRMQDTDGGVFFKVAALTWPGYVLPHHDLSERVVIGKATASTLNLAAVAAQASRIYAVIDPAYSKRLLASAQSAWRWAKLNETRPAPVYQSGGSGLYNDSQLDDEFLWAAAQLAQVSAKPEYRNHLRDNLVYASLYGEREEALWWRNTRTMAFLSLARVTDPAVLEPQLQRKVRNEIISYSRRTLDKIEHNAFQIPYYGREFIWGSNGGIANLGIVLSESYRLTRDPRLLVGARDLVHYLLGHNIHGLSFVTGFGQNSPLFPHHRLSAGDALATPIPGYLVGGPNEAREDEATGVKYGPGRLVGPLSYVDHQNSFASNEVAINWSASFTYLLAAVQMQGACGPEQRD